jgi:hypothetical protein
LISIRVNEGITGLVLIEFGDQLNGLHMALSHMDAIRLCEQIRQIVERPTQLAPSGKNVVIMAAEGPKT